MPAYCLFPFWVLIVLPLAVWATPSFAENLPQAELVLTQGESGLPRDNIFYTGEKVFATLRITGLGDQRPYMGQIQVTGTVLDANGTEVLRVEKEPEYYSQVLGGDSIESTLVINSDSKNTPPPGDYSLIVSVVHQSSGRISTARRQFTWKEIERMCANEMCLFLDSEMIFPSGPVLQPVRPYVLRTRINRCSFVDRKSDVQIRTKLTQPDGGDPKNERLNDTLSIAPPIEQELPKSVWFSKGIFFRNAGANEVCQELVESTTHSQAEVSIPVVVFDRGLPVKEGNNETSLFFYFSYGLHGPIRKPHFLPNEDIWVTLGAVSMPEIESTTFNLEACFLDDTGAIIRKIPLGEIGYRRNSTEGLYFGEWQIPFPPNNVRLDTIQKLQILVTDKKTGKVSQVSAPIHFSNIKGVAAYNFQVSRDAHNQTPGGQFLTAGQPYYLNCDITKFTVKDYAIDITHSVKAFTEDGQPIAGTELVLDHKRALSVAEKLNAQLPLAMQISLNRPGKFLLRSTITDNLSGQTYTSDMPAEVVSPFQFVKEEAALEN